MTSSDSSSASARNTRTAPAPATETDRVTAALARGPVLLDAAMGTRLIARGLDLARDDPALWNLRAFEAVLEIHTRDVAAGARALLTNTFGANRAWLERYGQAGDVAAINRAAVGLAREAAGPDRLVLGSVGPTAARTAEIVREQAELLVEAGVDAIVFETFSADSIDNSALPPILRDLPVPAWVSLHDWPDSRESECLAADLLSWGAAGLGINCCRGMTPALTWAARMRRITPAPLLAKPSAVDSGDAPPSFAAAALTLCTLGVRLLGGCCGTTERHIAAMRASLEKSTDR